MAAVIPSDKFSFMAVVVFSKKLIWHFPRKLKNLTTRVRRKHPTRI
jgi:hypothetical protein